MAAPVALEQMLAARTLWHAGRHAAPAPDGEPTGFDALDALLPQRGWPRRALSELLLPADGVGELSLLLPTLARLTRAGAAVAVIAPPCVPYAPAWQAAGVDLAQLQVVEAGPRDALWAFEQCLRSGACAAVLGWPATGDAQALRRLQVAADSGDCLGFALRDRRHAANPSPAALRLEATGDACGGIAWRVRKCRGGPVPADGFVLSAAGAVADSARLDVARAMANRLLSRAEGDAAETHANREFPPRLAGGGDDPLARHCRADHPDARRAAPGRTGRDGGPQRSPAASLRLVPAPDRQEKQLRPAREPAPAAAQQASLPFAHGPVRG